MIVAALTGSIAMGKSETARIFKARGIPVFDSDAVVHELYAAGGAAVEPLRALVPSAIEHNHVDRKKLSDAVREKSGLLKDIEDIVHPLVRQRQQEFLERMAIEEADIVILDIPLLFEAKREAEVDIILVVSADLETQRSRALARPGMTSEKLDFIIAHQIPDQEKRARADYVIDTSRSISDTARQVDAIITALRNRERRL